MTAPSKAGRTWGLRGVLVTLKIVLVSIAMMQAMIQTMVLELEHVGMAVIFCIPVPYDLTTSISGMKGSSFSIAYEESIGIFKILRQERERERETQREREREAASFDSFGS